MLRACGPSKINNTPAKEFKSGPDGEPRHDFHVKEPYSGNAHISMCLTRGFYDEKQNTLTCNLLKQTLGFCHSQYLLSGPIPLTARLSR